MIEEKERKWRKVLVDLAKQVQASSLLHSPDVDCQPLLDCAREFLEKATACDMEDSL